VACEKDGLNDKVLLQLRREIERVAQIKISGGPRGNVQLDKTCGVRLVCTPAVIVLLRLCCR
jgi:hypothetical protein